RKPFKPTLWERQYTSTPDVEAVMGKNPEGGTPQRLEQVWFCGTHSNVGGGYVDNNLSNIALRWMIDKAIDAGLKIDWVTAQVNPFGELRESLLGFWRFIGAYRRPIDQPLPGTTTCESVHSSVADRVLNNNHDPGVPKYDPPNLEDFYRRHPD